MLLSAVSSTTVSFKKFITTSGVSMYLSFHLSFSMKFKVQCFLHAFSKQSFQLAITCCLSFHFSLFVHFLHTQISLSFHTDVYYLNFSTFTPNYSIPFFILPCHNYGSSVASESLHSPCPAVPCVTTLINLVLLCQWAWICLHTFH